MTPNPFLGVFFHWLGGLASGSFYVPYRFVRQWSWETYWLTGGFFSWIIAPWLLGLMSWAGSSAPTRCSTSSIATVILPASGPEAIIENGRPLDQSEGVKVESRAGGRTVLKVGSGRFTFVTKTK